MYTDFAYTRYMELILAIVAFIVAIVQVSLLSNLTLMLYNVEAEKKDKIKFSLVLGITYDLMIYIVYLLGGAESLSWVAGKLLVLPSPVHAILLYVVSVKFLKLPPIRILRPISQIFVYFAFISYSNILIGSVFFDQKPGPYNYLLNLFQILTGVVVHLIAFYISKYLLKKYKVSVMFSDKLFISMKKEYTVFIIKVLVVCFIPIFVAAVIKEQTVANVFIVVIIACIFALIISIEGSLSQKTELDSRDVHIKSLSKTLGDFNQLKHDFYNMLQTYGGYIEIGDLEGLRNYHDSLMSVTTHAGGAVELSSYLKENPPFISLLMSKSDYASRMDVNIRFLLEANFENLYIGNLDLCRAVACLLDNAIEGAAESKEKRVTVRMEEKTEDYKFIIITNSTSEEMYENILTKPGKSTKKGHSGLGVSMVRKVLAKYPNCRFHYAYYNNELSAYIEIKRN